MNVLAREKMCDGNLNDNTPTVEEQQDDDEIETLKEEERYAVIL